MVSDTINIPATLNADGRFRHLCRELANQLHGHARTLGAIAREGLDRERQEYIEANVFAGGTFVPMANGQLLVALGEHLEEQHEAAERRQQEEAERFAGAGI